MYGKKIILALTAAIAVTATLVVTQTGSDRNIFDTLTRAFTPLICGCVIAYLANLIMTRFESLFAKVDGNDRLTKARRPLAIFLSFTLIGILAALVVALASTQLHSSIAALAKGAETAWTAVSGFLQSVGKDNETLAAAANAIDWNSMANNIIGKLGNSDTLLSSAVNVGDTVTRAVTDLGLGFIFSIYLLMAKERVLAGAKTLSRTILPDEWDARLRHAGTVANASFSRFFVGQCTEAAILGCLCLVGMSIIGLPHAFTVSLCVGATALIPLFGAWIGGAIGALMILPDSLEKTIMFLVFFALLQAFENHFIYPRTMKHATGVSTVWVVAAAIAGGALGGIMGIILAVPTVATAQQLLDSWWKREDAGDDAEEITPPCNQRAE